MAWGNKNITRDDTDHPQPQKLPPNGWAKSEQRVLEIYADHPEDKEPINLSKFEREMTRDRIADIKEIVRNLTYGEMMLMAEEIAGSYPRLPGDEAVQAEFKAMLPQAFHRWSKVNAIS